MKHVRRSLLESREELEERPFLCSRYSAARVSSLFLFLSWCFKCTDTIRLIWDGAERGSGFDDDDEVLLNVLRCQLTY